MYQNQEEARIKLIQRFIPNATSETVDVFNECMKTDAFLHALPHGIAFGMLTHFIIPKKLGNLRYLVSCSTGIISYICSKLGYVSICCQKAVSLTNVHNQLDEERKERFYESDKQKPENKYFAPTDNLAEGEDIFWSNFDSEFGSTSNESNVINDNMYEELTHETQKSEKSRVTYDQLWAQHKEQQYRNFANQASSGMSIQNQQKKPH
ncbi:unnamed protein product [Xylocopa violacea]|uniref:OCIA domain-containing protein n=1 Tax=Xylocopa violacea TaxID=135666 RepID=A0ABP1NSW6_XYLVO